MDSESSDRINSSFTQEDMRHDFRQIQTGVHQESILADSRV